MQAENVVLRRFVIGSIATIALLTLAGVFAYMALFTPINDRGQSVFWPLLVISSLLFLMAIVFIVITTRAVQQKFLTTPRQNAIFLRRVSIGLLICFILESILQGIQAVLNRDLISLSFTVAQEGILVGMVVGVWQEMRRSHGMLSPSWLQTILGFLPFVLITTELQEHNDTRVRFIGIALGCIYLLSLGQGTLRRRRGKQLGSTQV